MGRHWVLRELVRLKVVEGEHLYPDCWMPSEQVIRFLHNDFGFDRPDDGMSNPPKARAIFDFMASELETETPNLHRAFDIPIRHVDSNSDLPSVRLGAVMVPFDTNAAVRHPRFGSGHVLLDQGRERRCPL